MDLCDGFSHPSLCFPSVHPGSLQEPKATQVPSAVTFALLLWFRLAVCRLLWVPRKPRGKLPRNRAHHPKRKARWAPFICYA